MELRARAADWLNVHNDVKEDGKLENIVEESQSVEAGRATLNQCIRRFGARSVAVVKGGTTCNPEFGLALV